VIDLFSRNKQGERRASPRVDKLLLTTHSIVSVGWLGVVVGKIALELAALTSGEPVVQVGPRLARQPPRRRRPGKGSTARSWTSRRRR
jgi:hypothetical protein